MLKVARYNLYNAETDRLYTFGENSDGTMTVRKFERNRLVEETRRPRAKCRSLWAWLEKQGYKRV